MMKPLVVANWKMNPSSWREAKQLFEATKKAAGKAKGISLVVAPPALFLRELAKGRGGGRIAFCVQSAHHEVGGAFTGEISMREAKDAGASYALVGHSEVRARGATNADTGRQVSAALAAKMRPILCVGEANRSPSGAHFGFVAAQLKAGFENVPASKLSDVIVAYEPIWAIGGEETMSPREMHEMAIFIRKTIVETHGQKGISVRIIYGGSVNEENSDEMLRDGDVSGLLIGHVSVDAGRFSVLMHSLANEV